MRILKRSVRKHPRLSLILLDWSVRESFHLLHYLKDQTVPRDSFEVVLIEYYDCDSPAARKFEEVIDTWMLLEMPSECYYHKHLMYNAGVVVGKGDILLFGDSDAMVRPDFLKTIFNAFDRDPLMVYHMDEFRNARRDFHPFNYPSFEDVLGEGCINNADGMTTGIVDEVDPMHTRNYGACMCARRQDILAIGGADEDLTYLGHICGPYDMTFRLMNLGRRLTWEREEYLYHTWHPGSDGIDNYLGPHDGRNMSTTAFQALCSGRVKPSIENEAIRRMRTGGIGSELLDVLINRAYLNDFMRSKLGESVRRASYNGFNVYQIEGTFYAVPQSMGQPDLEQTGWRDDECVLRAGSFTEIRDTLDALSPRLLEAVDACNICAVGKRFAVLPHVLGPVDFRIRTHREDPRILWGDTLEEARNKAIELTTSGADKEAAFAEPLSRSSHSVFRSDGVASDVARVTWDVADLERRITDVESRISGIYQSRTWQTLTRASGYLQRAIGMRRPGNR